MLSIDEFEDLIRHENEGTFLDFKAIQYKKEVYFALLKDVLAMANAAFTGDKYIVIGVKALPDGTREFPGIQEEFVDEAIYQQLIHGNIEPEVPFSYRPVQWDGKLFGMFAITACTDKPYMMKKAYSSFSTDDASNKMLRPGEMWIRKGSSQFPVLRRDLDKMRSFRSPIAEEQVNIAPVGLDKASNKILIPRRIPLPSEEEAERIKTELEKRKKGQSTPVSTSQDGKFIVHRLAHRSEAELLEELKRVKKTFESEDLHSRFEKNGVRLNFILTNSGEQYLKDVSVLMTVSAGEGLEIAPRIYKEFTAIAYPSLNENAFTRVHTYPEITRQGKGYKLEQYLADVKHNMPEKIFINDIRMSIDEDFAGQSITFEFKVLAENLPKPIEKRLVLETVLKS